MKRPLEPQGFATWTCWNERLALSLRALDSGAGELAEATKRLRERLDQHDKNERRMAR